MKIGVKWGVLLGIAICAWTALVHLLGWYTVNLKEGERADVAAIILPILAIGLAIRERRQSNPGKMLTVAQGMVTGIAAGLISVPIAAGFLWFYHHQINPEWVNHLIAYHSATMQAEGASAAAIAAKVKELREASRDTAQLTGALVGTTLISILISFAFSLALRRSK